MTAVTRGTAGSYFDSTVLTFTGFPYTSDTFNVHVECPTASGDVDFCQDPSQMRNCTLAGLNGLNKAWENLRNRIYGFLNLLVGCGLAGFR